MSPLLQEIWFPHLRKHQRPEEAHRELQIKTPQGTETANQRKFWYFRIPIEWKSQGRGEIHFGNASIRWFWNTIRCLGLRQLWLKLQLNCWSFTAQTLPGQPCYSVHLSPRGNQRLYPPSFTARTAAPGLATLNRHDPSRWRSLSLNIPTADLNQVSGELQLGRGFPGVPQRGPGQKILLSLTRNRPVQASLPSSPPSTQPPLETRTLICQKIVKKELKLENYFSDHLYGQSKRLDTKSSLLR